MRIVSLHLIQGIIEDYNLSVICLAIELAQRKCSEEVGRKRPVYMRFWLQSMCNPAYILVEVYF